MNAFVNSVVEVIGKIIAAGFLSLCAYLAPKLKEWLTIKLGKTNLEYLERLVSNFVIAAEQLYKAEDPDGFKRKDYVYNELKKLGICINDQLEAMIEAAVYGLPHEGNK